MSRRSYDKAFFRKPTIESCYWGGFLAADGSVSLKYRSVKVALAEKDRDHVKAFGKAIGYDGDLVYSSKTKSYSLQLYAAEEMLYDLENVFNIVPNKSLSLKPPAELDHWGLDFQKAFLVGFIDGDGSIRYDKRDGLLILDVFSGSKRLVDWAKRVIEETYGFESKKIFANKNGRGFLYRLIGRRAEVVRADLRSHCSSQLSRKWDVNL